MSLIGLLASPIVGGLLGQLGTGFNMFLSEWKEDKAHKRKLEEMRLAGELKDNSDAWVSFAKAQESLIPSTASYPWVNAVISLTRVVITLALTVLLFVIWNSSPYEQKADISDALLTMAFTAISFWFGERFQFNSKKKGK